MNLQEAVERINVGEAMSRPYLLHERKVFITYEGPKCPLKLRRVLQPELAIDWVPNPTELLANDWCTFADPRSASK